MRNVIAFVFFVLMACPAAAFAQQAPPPASPRTEPVWYGYQTLALDAGTFAMAYLAGEKGSSQLAYLSIGSYVLSGPLVHAAHGRYEIAGVSFLLRAGAPVGGALLGLAVASTSHDDWAGLGGILFGGIIGIGTASLVDACALSLEEVPAAPSFQIGITPTRGGATLGAAGAF